MVQTSIVFIKKDKYAFDSGFWFLFFGYNVAQILLW